MDSDNYAVGWMGQLSASRVSLVFFFCVCLILFVLVEMKMLVSLADNK